MLANARKITLLIACTSSGFGARTVIFAWLM
jgi:hypothetical protein